MKNLQRRLLKLEHSLTDTSGPIPDSPAWVKYWMDAMEIMMETTDPRYSRPIPLKVVRAWMQAQPDSD
jgi:hypothetical protein